MQGYILGEITDLKFENKTNVKKIIFRRLEQVVASFTIIFLVRIITLEPYREFQPTSDTAPMTLGQKVIFEC